MILRRLMAVVLVAALVGCASSRIDGVLGDVRSGVQQRVGVSPDLRASSDTTAAAEVERLLAKPVSLEDTLRIALVNSPQLQASLHEASASMASSIQSGRLINPTFTFERLVRGESVEFDRMLSFQVLDLLTWPWRSRVADLKLEQDKLRAMGEVVDQVASVRRAWVEAVAAQQMLTYYRDVLAAAEASAELARRMQGAGNFNTLQRAREQAFYADAVVQVARAQHAQVATREALVRHLGLDPVQARALRLPERLPDLPQRPKTEAEVAQAAMDQRLDVLASRRALDATARSAGVERVRSVVSRFEVGVVRNSETGEPTQRGYEVEVPIPIFDAGDAVRAQSRATLEAAVFRNRQVIVQAQSQVRESYHAYRTAHDIARHYRDEVVPLRKAIAEENLYRYNGMLIGVFELLADAREQVASVIAAIETQRDFWLADAALSNALIGRSETLRTAAPALRVAAGGGDPH